MALPANLLFERTFPGAGYPSFSTVWPGFTFPAGTGVNSSTYSKPVVDGSNHGIPARTVPYLNWRAKATSAPGMADYQAELWTRWQNAGFAGRREVGLLLRMKDADNCIAVRVRSVVGGNPELRVFKILGGVETQIGSTYTGAGLSATKMNAGMRWRARVEDLDDGNTRVTAYLSPTGPADKGTEVVDWTGDLGILRGQHTVGVEHNDLVGISDVWVGDLRCYDLADEWNPTGPPPAPGSGWQVALGASMYSMDDLAELDPPVYLEEVSIGYGLGGNQAMFSSAGSWSKTGVLKPGTQVICYHDGDVRFRGWVESGGRMAQPGETQQWLCGDGYFAARDVILEEDNFATTLWFNVEDSEADEYDATRQDMTLGDVLKFLFDKFIDKMRFYGCAPPDSVPYVTSELAALDGKLTNLAIQGTLTAAVDMVLRYMGHRFMLWWDPTDLVWHFFDVTTLPEQAVECTAEHLKLRVKPDRTKAYTAVEWRGSSRDRSDDLELSLDAGDLYPAWQKAQEDAWTKAKRSRSLIRLKILSKGMAADPEGNVRMYVDVAAGELDTDDCRGWILTASGAGFVWLCVHNSSTRVWFSPPYTLSSITVGTDILLNANGVGNFAELSAAGVGRGYVLRRPEIICPTWGGKGNYKDENGIGVPQGGFCGSATVTTKNREGGFESEEEYAYRVKFPTQQSAEVGMCEPLVVLSEKPKPINLVALPKKSSPPATACEASNRTMDPSLNVTIKLPQEKPDVAYFRCPEGEDEFQGPAFEEWNVRREFQVSDPDFTIKSVQEAGRKKAAEHILAVKSQLPYLFDVELATPWHVTTPERPVKGQTSTWFGMQKALVVTSARRATGFESAAGVKLPVLRATFRVRENTTIISAGTVSAWLQVNAIDIARAFEDRKTLKRALEEIQRLEEFRKRMIAKSPSRVHGVQKGQLDACEVDVIDKQSKRVVTVQKKDEDLQKAATHTGMKTWLGESLSQGVEPEFPGSPLAVPGQDGAAANQAIDGPAVRPLSEPRWPFTGPMPGHEGYGRYGGKIVTDPEADGAPPRELLRAGGFVFRKREDASGEYDGSPGPEFAVLDEHGNPTGPWTEYNRPSDLPNGVWPFSALSAGSTSKQLLDRSQHLAGRMLASETEIGKLVAAGKDVGGGVAAHADLLDHVIAGIIGPDYRLVRSSLEDPGGPVWEGPMRENGANAGTYWRVHPTAKVPVLVAGVPPGTGDSGGAWQQDASGPGGTPRMLINGYVFDKQVHLGGDWEMDTTRAGGTFMPGAPEPGHPFGLSAHLRQFNDQLPSGWAFTVSVPDGAKGTPMFWADVGEDFFVPSPGGTAFNFQIDWAYQASPWTAVGAGTAKTGVTADGTGTGTGQFRQPGGAVPPGLRRVTASVVHNAAPPRPGVFPVLTGGGAQFAVTEEGYLLVVPVGLEMEDSCTATHIGNLERAALADPWAFEFEKAIAEGLGCTDGWDMRLNPSADSMEALGVGEGWLVEIV